MITVLLQKMIWSVRSSRLYLAVKSRYCMTGERPIAFIESNSMVAWMNKGDMKIGEGI